jgi:hypothetical protein
MRARACTLVLASLLLGSCGTETPRYYVLSKISGVTEVDVYSGGETAGSITDRKAVAAIVSFLNSRRDHWFDAKGRVFGTFGDIELLDAHKKRVAWISFGGGGMVQSRPTMTYRDSVAAREFIVTRIGPPAETQRDADALCSLLGGQVQRRAEQLSLACAAKTTPANES